MEKLGDLVRRYVDLRDEIARENLDNVAVEYVSTEKTIEELKSEIKYITERLEHPYRNVAQESADVFVRIMRERDIRESKEQIEEINEAIADLENRLEQAEGDMKDFDSVEASIKEEAQKLDVASVEAITDQEVSNNAKGFARIREDSEFLNKMREEQQKIIEDLRRQLISKNKEKSYYEIDIEKAQDIIDKIDQNQANGYNDLEARKADQDKLAEKIVLLEQNCAKLAELSRDKVKEAEETMEALNNYTAQSQQPADTATEPAVTVEEEQPVRDITLPGDRKVKGIRKILHGAGQLAATLLKPVKNFLKRFKRPEEPYDAEHLSPLWGTGYDPSKDNGDRIITARELYGNKPIVTNVEEPIEEEEAPVRRI